MYNHFIVIVDSYELGKRIAYQIVGTSDDRDLIKESLEIIKLLKSNNQEQYTTHFVSTDKATWNSVIESDPFFDKIKLFESLDEFIKCIKNNRQITSKDIAEILLERYSLSALPLMKLVYFVYAEFLTKFKESLFTNSFEAFKLGPVDRILWNQGYKGKNKITPKFDEITSMSPVDAKLIASGKYDQVMSVIEDITKHEETFKNPYYLKELTHQVNTPWQTVYKKDANARITDDIILEKHEYEKINC